ncbi:MAG: YicC/YloC family endoribonuclease, partial [Burkholderiaceae bacterium]|nr:YicC/YloC family endoribonuclease [Burkholderiaceae bacterium]
MTGYATTTRETAAGTLTLEIRSVNSRFLDLQFRMNDDLRAVEPVLRETIMKQATRGKIECRLSLGRNTDAAASRALNMPLLDELARFQDEIRARFSDAPPLSVNELLRWPGVVEDAEAGQESLLAEVQAAMSEALKAFVEARAREGAALTAMLIDRVEAMAAIVQRIEPLIP